MSENGEHGGGTRMTDRIVVLGGYGQLGSEIVSRGGDRAMALGRDDADVTNAAALDRALKAAAPAVVINCVAYNLVDKAEDEPDAAFAVNAWGVRNIAQWCEERRIPLMHISTDYVFGKDTIRATPYVETDVRGPLGVYGTSKSMGESIALEHCPQSWVVRTCGLYGRRATKSKGNFVETMLRLGRERPELKIIDDQRCTPTNAGDLAEALMALIQTGPFGVYHATNAGDCSWYEFANEIFRLKGLSPRVIPITSEQYGAKAPRPRYSVLNCQKLADTIGRPLRPWQDALTDYLAGAP
jgi:dTDP-4-dehydrorhamnose reductase